MTQLFVNSKTLNRHPEQETGANASKDLLSVHDPSF